ncbi:MAG TPA: hypothetical protein ENN91_00975 [Firmicutes bacterium]|nr:hypothetical protein [Bacillota bacterium]
MKKGPKKEPQPWYFLWGTLAWTWIFLGLAGITGQGWLEFPTVVLTGLGSFGPLIVALILISLGFWDLRLDRSAAAYLRRSFNPFTISLRLAGIIFFLSLFFRQDLRSWSLYRQGIKP